MPTNFKVAIQGYGTARKRGIKIDFSIGIVIGEIKGVAQRNIVSKPLAGEDISERGHRNGEHLTRFQSFKR